MTAWSEAAEAQLRRLAAAGWSDEEIAAALGVPRSAVNGKRWRLGLTMVRSDAYAMAVTKRMATRWRKEIPP